MRCINSRRCESNQDETSIVICGNQQGLDANVAVVLVLNNCWNNFHWLYKKLPQLSVAKVVRLFWRCDLIRTSCIYPLGCSLVDKICHPVWTITANKLQLQLNLKLKADSNSTQIQGKFTGTPQFQESGPWAWFSTKLRSLLVYLRRKSHISDTNCQPDAPLEPNTAQTRQNIIKIL